MCLLIIKYSILITIKSSIPNKVSVKSFPAEVVDRFIKSNKVEVSMHLSKMIYMRYNGKKT